MNKKKELIKEDTLAYDLFILKSLYFGNHLNVEDIKRCKQLLHILNISLKYRIKNEK